MVQSGAALMPHLPALMAAKVIGLDIETTGLDPHLHAIRLIQLAIGELVVVIDCQTFLPAGLPLLRDILHTPAVKVLQNAKFDLQFLMPLAVHPAPVFDTMLAGRLLYMPGEPRRVNLETLAQHYLDETLDKQEQKGDWRGSLTQAQLTYAAKDAEILLRLRQAMIPRLIAAGLVKIAEIEFSCVHAVAQIEYNGIFLDRTKWTALAEETTAARDAALEKLYPFTGRPMAQTTLWGEEEPIGMNLDSNPFVLSLLSRHGITVENTSKRDLYPFRGHPLVAALTEYRKASKALSAILLPVLEMIHPVTGRLHAHYGQISAYSGRMSCTGPNIQQIPRDKAFRACFVAPQGRRLVIADYSQIELRVAAQMSGDARMLDAYRRGEDLHLLTASLVSGRSMADVSRQERQAAKAVNFGLIYGMGAQGLQQYAQQSYGAEMSLSQATLFRQRFFEAYGGIRQWHQRLKEHPPLEGRTLTGRRFPVSLSPSLPELSNTPVQGTAADIIKKALGMLARQVVGTDIRLIGVVHDEILMECPVEKADAAATLLKETMEKASNDILPLVPADAEAHTGASWAEK